LKGDRRGEGKVREGKEGMGGKREGRKINYEGEGEVQKRKGRGNRRRGRRG
jgi:hypothetical protein